MFRDISAQAYILVLQTDVKYRDKNFVLCLLFVPNLQNSMGFKFKRNYYSKNTSKDTELFTSLYFLSFKSMIMDKTFTNKVDTLCLDNIFFRILSLWIKTPIKYKNFALDVDLW